MFSRGFIGNFSVILTIQLSNLIPFVLGMAHTDSDQNFLGVDLFAVAESDTVPGDKGSEARNVFDRVLLQVALVDAVQTLDVGITLVLQCVPVKGGGSNLREAVLLGVVDGLGNGS